MAHVAGGFGGFYLAGEAGSTAHEHPTAVDTADQVRALFPSRLFLEISVRRDACYNAPPSLSLSLSLPPHLPPHPLSMPSSLESWCRAALVLVGSLAVSI